MTNGHGKSESVIVAVKPANKADKSAAEQVRGGGSRSEASGAKDETKENAGQQSTCRAQSRVSVSGTGTHTASNKDKEGREVHVAPPPYQHPTAGRGVLRA